MDENSDHRKNKTYSTGLKCKNCGYEVAIIRVPEQMKLFHTAIEEGYLPNAYCFMVHRKDRAIPNTAMVEQKSAELSMEDREALLRMLQNSGLKTSPDDAKPETDAQDRNIKYVIHFAKGHYVVVDNYFIDRNGFLGGFVAGKVVLIAESFTYITAIDKDKLSDMQRAIFNSQQLGGNGDEESYMNAFAATMDAYTDHVEGE